ncbi:NADH:ubiquinone oxidoreductase [Vibrio tritonius]|uniref:NADH:ubiquinone oxidoreductase n=1 Tax=Vibrio tritonius TaxID=1435069 RepID=A0ABS7YLE2_9VIBR|nr:NADH:ubiquinone oxidoreductase [Vibrio tritonius]MCA2015696.1 NADH:ubiquinone oxidoreductase [Vibrio tritonius]
MKLLLVLMTSVSAGVASGDHFHSFLLGLGVATLAVGCCHWFAFRSSKFPELALFLLICGLLAKIAITVVGVMWGLSHDLITSPLVFALSYLFFSIVATYVWFRYQEYLLTIKQKVREKLA